MQALRRRRFRGQGLAEVAVVCAIMTSMGGGNGAVWQTLNAARRAVATNQLRQIHAALVMQADDNDGQLPAALFYPDLRRNRNAARTDPRSIVNQVSGLPGAVWVSPAAPATFQDAGLTYVWNTSVNGQSLDALSADTWLLADMNAAGWLLPDLIPRSTHYLVLYADGRVEYQTEPPQLLPANQAANLRAQVQQAGGQAGAPPANPPGGFANPGAGAGAPTTPGAAPGGPGGAPAAGPVPDDPEAAVRREEEKARQANPDKVDALYD